MTREDRRRRRGELLDDPGPSRWLAQATACLLAAVLAGCITEEEAEIKRYQDAFDE